MIYRMPPHDCSEDGHSWGFIGYDEGRPCYRCRFCQQESES